MLTKSLTSFTGFVVGDAIAQASTGEKYNYWRTARFAAYGFCIHAPICHVWYGLLDRNVMVKAPTRWDHVGHGLLLLSTTGTIWGFERRLSVLAR